MDAKIYIYTAISILLGCFGGHLLTTQTLSIQNIIVILIGVVVLCLGIMLVYMGVVGVDDPRWLKEIL